VAELRATYRLQLGPGLGFAEVRALVPYLRELGVSHLYLSPCLQARAGSTHGYDVVDPTRVSEELGGEPELRALAGAGLGVVLDIVPNHMAASEENPSWADPERRTKVFDVDPETGRHRRFFDIDELAGVRQEDPEVFALTHAKVVELVCDGVVDGVRVDHPDGLRDPAGYLERLRAGGVERVWVEKILEPGESLRAWPVEGTTGYEFLNDAQGVFVDHAGEEPLTALHAELTGDGRPFSEVAEEAKREQAETTFRPEVERLRRMRDFPDLARWVAALPVYRTYLEPWSGRVSPEDRAVIEHAGLPDDVARALLALDPPEWVARFQQTTPPVMAKGVEDTAFYRHTRLLALNEVGGDPGRWGISVRELHEANAERARRFPRGLLVTQTHDTKRSGDVRARIGALSGMAEAWRERVMRWRELCAPLREGGAPDPSEEYLVYQTLVGAWPLEPERLEAYVEKALREEKTNTGWVDGDPEWEARVRRFCRRLYEHRPFREDFEPFAAVVADAGRRAALGQLLLKLTAPGVPDVYQGDELEALSLVDPDNRRRVDWDARRRLLEQVRAGAAPTPETAKLWLIVRALGLRARRPEAFAGAYEPVEAGADAVAYVRGGAVLAAVGLRPGADVAALELGAARAGRWHDVLGDGAERELDSQVRLRDLVEGHPLRDARLALLERVA
jgi:(1->4)-alpha-D-glucan 1-alpha-D-glucosylmutase